MPRYECQECGVHTNRPAPCRGCGSGTVELITSALADKGVTPAVPTLDETGPPGEGPSDRKETS